MKTIKTNEHFTAQLELTEAEVQSLVGLFQEHMMYRQLPTTMLGGLRQEIYNQLVALLATKE